MQKYLLISLIAIFMFSDWAFAQDEDGLGTETVNVTKAYTPTISDAFKIKSVPGPNDSISLKKKKIEYNIFSVPVASTFTPAKGQASAVKKTPPPVLYNSSATLGVGNPANILANFYTTRIIDRDEQLDGQFEHNSSFGNIDGVVLKSIYSNTKLGAVYNNKKSNEYNWGGNVGFQHQLYNWYGIPPNAFSESLINSIDERQNYFMADIGGHINMDDSFFKDAQLHYRRFWDAVKSGENRAQFDAGFEFPVAEEVVKLNASLDFVNGSFQNAALNNTTNSFGIDYSHLQFGISPSLVMKYDELTLDLGVKLVYGMDTQNNDNNFYIYPEVSASYALLDDAAILYGGVDGDLIQNSYYGLVDKNPYVSPTLQIRPTDQKYNAHLGIKGKLLPSLNYNLKGSYTAANFVPLFKLNPENTARNDEKGYYYGNSFEVFYDDVKTIGVFGELNYDVNQNFTIGVNASFFDYDTETDNPAWNLPNIKGSLLMDYQIDEKWFAGVELFYVGNREDVATDASFNAGGPIISGTILELDSFFDANLHVGYRFNEQWTFFVNGANLTNNNYERWANFKVQGLQVLGGATYKFDF